MIHSDGDTFILSCLFTGLAVPTIYYIGLDNRPTIAVGDTLSSLTNEPSGNGYTRQALNTSSGWTIAGGTGMSNIVTFSASGVGWGPVQNIFLATTSDNSGVLIASAPLTQSVSLESGDMVNMRFSLSLSDCSLC